MVNEIQPPTEDKKVSKEEAKDVNTEKKDASEVKSDDVFHKKEMEEATQKTEGEV